MRRALVPLLLILSLVLLGANLYQWQTARLSPTRVIADRFIEVWALQPDTWVANRFMGISTLQNPMDAWVTLEIINDVKPDVILETGTYRGGSALLWAMFLEHVNRKGRVITIDIKHQAFEARTHKLALERIEFLVGSSTSPEIVEAVGERVKGKRVLAILDSAHSRDHVYEELKTYAPMIPVGSYIVVQDGAVCGHPLDNPPCPGPYEAVEDFLAETDGWVAVREHERHLMTSNPMGYLKRVR